METFHEQMAEYKKQLQKGAIQGAYKGLMEYILSLKTHFKNKFPDYFVPSSIYFGYMDMTYFALFPKSLKERGLKIAVVFIHDKCRFEVWLSANNKQIQTRYWKLLKESHWSKYPLVSTTKGADSIAEHILAEDPDFCDLQALTKQIESETVKFIRNVESFLSKHDIPD